MTIRLATPEDEQTVLLLLNQLGEIVNEFVQSDPDNVRSHEVGRKNYQNAMRRNDRIVFLVEENHRVLAVATYFILTDFITGKQYAHIDDFVVDKDHRNKGIGTQLLEYIKTYAREHGMHALQLTTSLPLHHAHEFYEKRGGTFARKVIKFSL